MHIGLIMDGNGRWAKARNLPRVAGHLQGIKSTRRVIYYAATTEIDFLTLYVFSTENWNRPEEEVNYLMKLLVTRLPAEIATFNTKGIRILFRGNTQGLPPTLKEVLEDIIEKTKFNKNLTVCLAINYGGQDEIVRTVNKFIKENPGKAITKEDIKANLDLPGQVGELDMIVRSAGEKRLSNFLLYDSAYAELLSIDKFWPEWGPTEVDFIIKTLKSRKRSFGRIL